MANPFFVNPMGGAGGQVAQQLTGLGQQFAQQREMEQQQAQIETNRALVQQALSGDEAALDSLIANNPQLGMAINQEIMRRAGADTAEKQARVMQLNQRFFRDYFSTPEEGRGELLSQYASNPEFAMLTIDDEIMGADPTQRDAMARMAAKSTMPEFYDEFIKQREVERPKTQIVQTPVGFQVVNQDTGEVIREQVIPESQAEFERIQQERNEELERQRAAEERRIETAQIERQDRESARRNANEISGRALNIALSLADEETIAPVTGWWDRLTPTMSGESADVINKALELKDLLTLDNLKLMSGVLTDRDIQILARAGSGLNVDDWGFTGSEGGVVKQLRRVAFLLEEKLQDAVDRGDLSAQDLVDIKSGRAFGEGNDPLGIR